MPRKTHEKFMEQLNAINPQIEVLGKYEMAKKPINCKCAVCGNEWSAQPANLLGGSGCPSCSRSKKHSSKKLTNEEFLRRVSETNKNVEVFDKYVNARSYVRCRCKICGNEWNAIPYALMVGRGCFQCGRKVSADLQRKTQEQFVEDMNIISPNTKIIGEYKAFNKKVRCECVVCGNEWNALPGTLYRGCGCPKCGDKRSADAKRMSDEEFRERMRDVNSDIEIISPYKESQVKVNCRCKICRFEWKATPSNLLRGRSCPACSASKGEHEIATYLTNNGIEFEKEKVFCDLLGDFGGNLRFDFYIESKNLVIEYQGRQHEIPIDAFGGEYQLKKQQRYDQYKRDYAREHGIRLLEIWYYDFGRIPEILDKRIFKTTHNKSA